MDGERLKLGSFTRKIYFIGDNKRSNKIIKYSFDFLNKKFIEVLQN